MRNLRRPNRRVGPRTGGPDLSEEPATRVKRLEDLIVQLDATFSDMEAAKRKGYLTRDLKVLRDEANGIYVARRS